jgi:excisionase family DNA binding protein
MIALFLTTSQAAQRLGVSRQRINQFILSGRLPALQIAGRYFVGVATLDAFAKLPRLRSGRPSKAAERAQRVASIQEYRQALNYSGARELASFLGDVE